MQKISLYTWKQLYMHSIVHISQCLIKTHNTTLHGNKSLGAARSAAMYCIQYIKRSIGKWTCRLLLILYICCMCVWLFEVDIYNEYTWLQRASVENSTQFNDPNDANTIAINVLIWQKSLRPRRIRCCSAHASSNKPCITQAIMERFKR